jgi:biotin synthase-like enzyme
MTCILLQCAAIVVESGAGVKRHCAFCCRRSRKHGAARQARKAEQDMEQQQERLMQMNEQRVVLITGGARRVGAGIARLLHARGCGWCCIIAVRKRMPKHWLPS